MKILINNKEQNPETIKAIQVDDYLVFVNDYTNINFNSFWIYINKLSGFIDIVSTKNSLPKSWFERLHDKSQYFNIVASTKRIDKSIPLIFFKEQTVEELAEINSSCIENVHQKIQFKVGFITGFVLAKYSGNKYNEDDLKNAIKMAKGIGTGAYIIPSENTIIQSLNQPKLPDVINLEMDEYCCDGDKITELCNSMNCTKSKFKLKTTSTPEGEIIEITI